MIEDQATKAAQSEDSQRKLLMAIIGSLTTYVLYKIYRAKSNKNSELPQI